MKKTSRKALSLFLAVLMLCSIMSISAFATSDDPEITVYFTTGNFSSGGYNFITDTAIDSVYQGNSPTPATSTAFSNDLFAVTLNVSDIDTTATRVYYNAPTSFTGNPNVLDVVIQVLIDAGRTPYGGWDSYNTPNGGYLTGFANDGSTNYYGYTEYHYNGHLYYHYTGTNWQIAYNTTSGGTLYATSTYATSITNLFDGMHIVVDLSDYDMYYKIS